jgi:hypothetical protein
VEIHSVTLNPYGWWIVEGVREHTTSHGTYSHMRVRYAFFYDAKSGRYGKFAVFDECGLGGSFDPLPRAVSARPTLP